MTSRRPDQQNEAMPSANINFGSRTDVGTHRELNEDAVLAAPPVFAVADGMGGHAAGEVAAALAIAQLRILAELADIHPEHILQAVASANRAIMAHELDREETIGMGTTVSGLCLGTVGGTPHWFVFNVGDSRVYHYAHGVLRQVTVDHSEVAELLAAGRITAEQAKSHPLRNVITRSLGSDPAPTADVWVLPVLAGERFLICSDGLTLEVPEEQLVELLGRGTGAQDTADLLVNTALAAGGRDNVSAVVVDIEPSEARQPVDVTTSPRGYREDM